VICNDFVHWLDDGQPDAPRASMLLHAATCDACAHELRIAHELDRALTVVVDAPVAATFNDAVIARIHDAHRGRRLFATCVQWLAEPIVSISLAIAIMIAWQHRIVANVVSAMIGPMQSVDVVAVLIALALAPLVLFISWRLLRVSESLA